MKDTTLMMDQYRSIKSQYQDAIVFFRLGDFYEMFYEDAETGSRELGIALTKRDAGEGRTAPMCGVPYHSADDYIKILVDKGYKVAICEQVEDPSLAKGLVKREVVRLITPGTYWEGTGADSSSYIVSIVPYFPEVDEETIQVDNARKKSVETRKDGRSEQEKHGIDTDMPLRVGFCACDLSTGEILVEDFGYNNTSVDWFFQEIERMEPTECIFSETIRNTKFLRSLKKALPKTYFTEISNETGRSETAEAGSDIISSIYGGERKSAVCENLTHETFRAFVMLMGYLKETQKKDLKHLKEPVSYMKETFCQIDQPTRRNLEISKRLSGERYGSLVWVLDQCCTSMGSRLLKRWLDEPLAKASLIQERLSAVDELFQDSIVRQNVRKSLSRVRDIERLSTKLSYNTVTARDLVAIVASLEEIPKIKEALLSVKAPLLVRIRDSLDGLEQIQEPVRKAIVDDPPLSVTEGGIIRDGYSKEIDELRSLASGGRKWVLEFEARERERTGIKNLKVGYNRVFGYYIEVTKSNLNMVPSDYIRKQTLSTCERFSVPELREKEALILGAQEKLYKEEYRLFCEIRDNVYCFIKDIQTQARLLAELDVLADFAHVATLYGYTRPEVKDQGPIVIKDGRHPVLERILPTGTFVPNDVSLSNDRRVLIITGPNMGGKSTYIRQTALIILMAQAGSFVPARSCTMSCFDRIFARVGAYDDLVLGQSTFMVEMSEVSRILRSVGKRSLVILDELGRGTSTFDGLSLAWAIIEYLAGPGFPQTFTLVATHYRELTLLSELKQGVVNLHVAVKKTEDDVIFLRKVIAGTAEGSFGIEVARMAGLPESIIKRAREILFGLETESRRSSRWQKGILGQLASRTTDTIGIEIPSGQMQLFGTSDAFSPAGQGTGASTVQLEVIRELESLNPDLLTPREALSLIYSIKERLGSDRDSTAQK